MKKRILTSKEHQEITTFLSDILYGRPVKITSELKRIYKQTKENLETLRNHYGIIETMIDNEELIQGSPTTETKK